MSKVLTLNLPIHLNEVLTPQALFSFVFGDALKLNIPVTSRYFIISEC